MVVISEWDEKIAQERKIRKSGRKCLPMKGGAQ